MKKPRLLIEDWLPAAAIGVECMRERQNAVALLPHTYQHIWWARRPLAASRAAVLASLLPSEFPRHVFERLLGFGTPSHELVNLRRLMDAGHGIEGGFGCDRSYKRPLRASDVSAAQLAVQRIFGDKLTILDPMAGGGSIPLESARLGFRTIANEYNPVACSVLEATLDYPFRFGERLGHRATHWAGVWLKRVEQRLSPFYPRRTDGLVHGYLFARAVPCPDTGFYTPLVPDWHLSRLRGSTVRVWAEPVVDKKAGTWKIRIIESTKAGKSAEPPTPSFRGGKGISLFTGLQISDDYIKAKAQAGEMRSALYAVAVKGPSGLKFCLPNEQDTAALDKAAKELSKHRRHWDSAGILPTETIPKGDKTGEALSRGMLKWADMFTSRQLLSCGVLVEESQKLHSDIIKAEGPEIGEAVCHLLALAIDKFVDYNCALSFWHSGRGVVAHIFEKHDFSFKASHAENAVVSSGVFLDWVSKNVLKAQGELSELPNTNWQRPEIHQGSAKSLPFLSNKSITAVVVDPAISRQRSIL